MSAPMDFFVLQISMDETRFGCSAGTKAHSVSG
jgi:hypothetical protein